MKKSKKFLGILLTVCMVMAMAAPAFAAEIKPDSDARGLAYMDLDTAPLEMQEDILAARTAIIYGDQAWTVDGAVTIANKDGTTQALPEFSDLFPGWDIPDATEVTVNAMPVPVASSIDDSTNAHFKQASDWENSAEFYSFSGPGDYVYVYAKSSPGDGIRFNIGFSKAGKNVGWCPSLSMTQAARLDSKSSVLYGVRGSAANSSSVGNYRIVISSDPGTITDFIDPEL